MLYKDEDEYGIITYTVCNDQGFCLIRTTSNRIAQFVNRHSKGISSELRLTVGGDPGTKQSRYPIFHHIRKYSR
jgi:hypothetical protein